MHKDIIRIKEKKIVWEGKFLRSVLIAYIDSSGTLREWESFERVNCKGIVAIVPVTDKREVLMVRQYSPPVNGYVIEFPAGLNDSGSSVQAVTEGIA